MSSVGLLSASRKRGSLLATTPERPSMLANLMAALILSIRQSKYVPAWWSPLSVRKHYTKEGKQKTPTWKIQSMKCLCRFFQVQTKQAFLTPLAEFIAPTDVLCSQRFHHFQVSVSVLVEATVKRVTADRCDSWSCR